MENRIGIFSFFSGAGFLDLGFEQSGYIDTLFVNEFHKPFMEIYKYSRVDLGINPPRFGYHPCDINDFASSDKFKGLNEYLIDAKKDYRITGFIGGPPCPDFSVAGKNRGKEGENGRLSATYVDLICRAKPDFFLFENVKGLWRTKKHREFYETLKDKLVNNGYLITEKLVNSIEYGVPQDRDRIILLGFQHDFLAANHYQFNGTHFLWNFDWSFSVKYDKNTVFNLPWPKVETFEENSAKPEPLNLPLELTVQYWFQKNSIQDHPNRSKYFTPQAGLAKFKTIKEGDDSKKSYKRLHRWRYSPTAAYGNNEVHLHPFKARRISVAEALAIQSLPKGFHIPDSISLTNSFKAIGNGVPFLAAKGFAYAILNFLNSHTNLNFELNGEVNSTKHSVIYKSTPKAEQLSVFEPQQ